MCFKNKQKPYVHIVTDNISGMANIYHMGGQRDLLTSLQTALTLHLLVINLYAAGGDTSPVFVYNVDPFSLPKHAFWQTLPAS